MAQTLEVWAEIRWEALEFVDLGHAVVVKAKIVAVGRGSDVSTELDATHVYWFREGLIVRLQEFVTRAEALEAAEIEE